MLEPPESDPIVLRLPKDLAGFVEQLFNDVGEHVAAGAPIGRGPAELEREAQVLMWDIREALGLQHPHDQPRPASGWHRRYVDP